MEKVRTVCAYIAENARWKKGVLSEDIAAILLCTALYMQPKSRRALYVQYKRVSSMFFNVLFYNGNVRSVCVCIAENGRWIRLFYPKISQRFCYVQHCTCTQKVAMHSIFNIKEFQACFSTLYYNFRRYILHGNSAYSVGLHSRECRLKDG